jgi:hypothetical protein
VAVVDHPSNPMVAGSIPPGRTLTRHYGLIHASSIMAVTRNAAGAAGYRSTCCPAGLPRPRLCATSRAWVLWARDSRITQCEAVARATLCPAWAARIARAIAQWVLPVPGGPSRTTLDLAATKVGHPEVHDQFAVQVGGVGEVELLQSSDVHHQHRVVGRLVLEQFDERARGRGAPQGERAAKNPSCSGSGQSRPLLQAAGGGRTPVDAGEVLVGQFGAPIERRGPSSGLAPAWYAAGTTFRIK